MRVVCPLTPLNVAIEDDVGCPWRGIVSHRFRKGKLDPTEKTPFAGRTRGAGVRPVVVGLRSRRSEQRDHDEDGPGVPSAHAYLLAAYAGQAAARRGGLLCIHTSAPNRRGRGIP